MSKTSAGILLYRIKNKNLEVFLVHPGGPFFAKKDLGSWSIPKGEFESEDATEAAKREFFEETGKRIEGELLPLSPIKQKSGKTVFAWAVEGDIEASSITSNLFELEWPPKSGKKLSFPEVDKAEWFPVKIAMEKILQGQTSLIVELTEKLHISIEKTDSDSSQLELF